MPRRTKSRSYEDERAFPVRILVHNIDGDTLRLRFNEARAWLNEHIGPGHWAMHGHGQAGRPVAMAFYFRTPAAAAEFIAAHPRFELVDTTDRLWYLQAERNPREPAPGEPLWHSTP